MRKAAEPWNICKLCALGDFFRCGAPQQSTAALNIAVRCTFWMVCNSFSTNITGALHLFSSVKKQPNRFSTGEVSPVWQGLIMVRIYILWLCPKPQPLSHAGCRSFCVIKKLNFKLVQNSKTISLFQNNSSTHQPTKNPTSLRSRVF